MAALVDTCLLVISTQCDHQLNVLEHRTQSEQVAFRRWGAGGVEHTVSDSWALTWKSGHPVLGAGSPVPLAPSSQPPHLATWVTCGQHYIEAAAPSQACRGCCTFLLLPHTVS